MNQGYCQEDALYDYAACLRLTQFVPQFLSIVAPTSSDFSRSLSVSRAVGLRPGGEATEPHSTDHDVSDFSRDLDPVTFAAVLRGVARLVP